MDDKLAFKGLPRKHLNTLSDDDFMKIQRGEPVIREIISSRSGYNTFFHKRDLGRIYRTVKPFHIRTPVYSKGQIIPDFDGKGYCDIIPLFLDTKK